MSTTQYALFDTSLGRCGIAWTDRGIAATQLPCESDAATTSRLLLRHPDAEQSTPRGEPRQAIEAIRGHLAGRLDPLDGFTLDDDGLPDFYKRVYVALRKVGPGKTVGYGELAARVGSPGAARAVGQAVGKNPFPIIVPCQRVLAAGGQPGGFSAHGGVATKRKMLAIEGVSLPEARAQTATAAR